MPRRKQATRRRKGEGTYKWDAKNSRHVWRVVKDGQHYEIYDQDPERGKARFAVLKAQLEKKIDVTHAKQTLGTYMRDTYLPSLVHEVKTTTLQDYSRRAGYYILATLGDHALTDIKRPLILAWVSAMLERRDKKGKLWSLHSIKQALRLLRRCLDAAVQDKLLEDNPASSVKPPQRRQGDERVIVEDEEDGKRSLSLEQELLLLEEVMRTDRHQGKDGQGRRSAGMYVLYLVALKLGLRRGELLGLRWKDVDFRKNVIRVRQQVVKTTEGSDITTPKTKNAKRDIPMIDLISTALKAHKLRLGALGNEFVFPNEAGDHYHPDTPTRHFRRACARLGLEGFTFHDLRATAITRWREAGVDAETAAALAGHGDVKVTLTVYSDAEARKRAALERVG